MYYASSKDRHESHRSINADYWLSMFTFLAVDYLILHVIVSHILFLCFWFFL